MKKKLTFVVISILVLCTGTITYANFGSRGSEVHFFSVGQSDCILIKSNNKNYLIDTGASYYTGKILTYLAFNNVKRLDGIIITHYHDDHYEGLVKILKLIKTDKVYLPDNKNNMKHVLSKSLSRFDTSVKYIDRGWTLKANKINLKAIGPVEKDEKSNNNNSDENNNSIVLQGKIGNVSYLFAGDCEKKSEDAMLKLNILKKCDVLKVPHHGINTSTSHEFLNKLKPKAAIITSNGKTPNKMVIKRLLNHNIIVLRTDHQGNIVIKNNYLFCDKSNIHIKLF